MLVLGLLALIVFWIVSAFQTRDFDRRREYGKIIAENIELNELFESFYFGEYEFGELPPNEDIRKQVEARYDRGVETRLAFHFAENLPKWVLLKAVNDVKSNQFSMNNTYGNYVQDQVYEFAKNRSRELIEMLEEQSRIQVSPNRRRRRKR